jgi:ABC-2 type transport system permease protein
MKLFVYYLKIWLRLTLSSFQTAFVSRIGAALFTIAKVLRFIFFVLIVLLVVTRTKSLVGYTLNQSLIFFLTFNVIDTLSQLLFREVYRFRPKIVNGDFDLTLIKPMNPLFTVLLGGADPMDLMMLVPYLGILLMLIFQIQFSLISVLFYLLLLFNSFLIATAFHIFVLALGILTTEIDHAIMIYRDVTSMARFPVDIYREPLRGFITFIIPIGIMMTFPPKALFGLLSPIFIILSFAIGTLFIHLSLRVWHYALTQYASASS